MSTDIQTRTDIELLMQTFYGVVLQDPELGPKFNNTNMAHHIPRIVNFWQSTVIGGVAYNGSPFMPHIKLQLEERHFVLWLQYFKQTIDQLFNDGPHAQQIWAKAQHVGQMFRFNLGLSE